MLRSRLARRAAVLFISAAVASAPFVHAPAAEAATPYKYMYCDSPQKGGGKILLEPNSSKTYFYTNSKTGVKSATEFRNRDKKARLSITFTYKAGVKTLVCRNG